MKKLKEVLNDAYKGIHIVGLKIPALNCGGCGCFAIELGTRLEKLGYKPKYVIGTYSSDYTIKKARNLLKKYKDKLELYDLWSEGFSHSHIMVKLGNMFIDGTGVYHKLWEYDEDLKNGITIDLPMLIKFNNEDSLWNDDFNRRRSVPKIKKLLNEILKPIPVNSK